MLAPLNTTAAPYSEAEADAAYGSWRFNCGPGALCAVFGLTPSQIRPKLLDFEKKGYTNPALMCDILKGMGAEFATIYRGDEPRGGIPIIKADYGLMRVQYSGPWTKPGVPMRARYRHTHWVALRNHSLEIFDVNAPMWLPESTWVLKLMPWLIKQCEPKSDGGFWPTHVIEITNART